MSPAGRAHCQPGEPSKPLFRGCNRCVSRFWYLSHILLTTTEAYLDLLLWPHLWECVQCGTSQPKGKHKSFLFTCNHANRAGFSPRWIHTEFYFAHFLSLLNTFQIMLRAHLGLCKLPIHWVAFGTLRPHCPHQHQNYISFLKLWPYHPFSAIWPALFLQ